MNSVKRNKETAHPISTYSTTCHALKKVKVNATHNLIPISCSVLKGRSDSVLPFSNRGSFCDPVKLIGQKHLTASNKSLVKKHKTEHAI